MYHGNSKTLYKQDIMLLNRPHYFYEDLVPALTGQRDGQNTINYFSVFPERKINHMGKHGELVRANRGKGVKRRELHIPTDTRGIPYP